MIALPVPSEGQEGELTCTEPPGYGAMHLARPVLVMASDIDWQDGRSDHA
jgi:hypothetical protein